MYTTTSWNSSKRQPKRQRPIWGKQKPFIFALCPFECLLNWHNLQNRMYFAHITNTVHQMVSDLLFADNRMIARRRINSWWSHCMILPNWTRIFSCASWAEMDRSRSMRPISSYSTIWTRSKFGNSWSYRYVVEWSGGGICNICRKSLTLIFRFVEQRNVG